MRTRAPGPASIRAHEQSGNYDAWFVEHLFLLAPALDSVQGFEATFSEYPPRQPQERQTEEPVERLRRLIEELQQPAQ